MDSPRLVAAAHVTVCIPTIPGRERLLDRALASVTAQTCAPRRTLVVCDTERRGAAWTRNQLLAQVRTDWVAWLDDDDELLPDHLRVLVRGANDSGADLIYSYPEFQPPGTVDPLATCDDSDQVVTAPIDIAFGLRQEEWLRTRGNFIAITTMTRVGLLKAVGGFPEPGSIPVPPGNNSGHCEDFLVLLKLLDAGARFHHVCGVRTWVYHMGGQQVGGRGTR